MAATSSPAQISQELLAVIDGSAQRALEFARTCPVGGTPQMMEVFLSKIDEYVWQFQQEAPLANWLRQQGLPDSLSKLETITRDLAIARQSWVAMYGGMLSTQSSFQSIWSEATRTATQNILGATAYSNAVYDKWQTGMFDLAESRCLYCHKPLDVPVPGGGYHIECARILGLIP
jgi:hypothetical protein